MGVYSVDALSISKIGDLLVEQLGDEAADYTFPEDFEKAIVDIGFKGLVYLGESSPYDLVVIGDALKCLERTNSMSGSIQTKYKSVSFVGSENITSIPYRAFYSQNQLTSFEIPESVTLISDGAFVNCSSLTEIDIPSTVAQVGYGAFSSAGLNKIKLNGVLTFTGTNNTTDTVFRYTPIHTLGPGSEYDVDTSGVDTIKSGIFGYCNLQSINLSNISTLGDHAFRNCSYLTTVESCPNPSASAFTSCVGLTSITFQNNVDRVNTYAFEGCTSLTSITLPESFSKIYTGAFYNCTGLISVTATGVNMLVHSGSNTGSHFNGCTKLESVYMPKLGSIGNNGTSYGSFRNCSALTTAQFGSVDYPLTVCPDATFSGCTNPSLEITVFVEPNTIDTIITNIRTGATKATIIAKAAVDMEYNGASYVAGDTIVTSVPDTTE